MGGNGGADARHGKGEPVWQAARTLNIWPIIRAKWRNTHAAGAMPGGTSTGMTDYYNTKRRSIGAYGRN